VSGSSLEAQLAALAAALRDPAAPAPADFPPSRLAVYRQLSAANVESLLTASFPRLSAVLGVAAWRKLLADFYRDWRVQTPLFAGLPGELASYLETARRERDDPPYLRELASFESLLLEVTHDARELPTGLAAPADWQHAVPVLNPLLRLRMFDFPVHEIVAGQIPQAAATPVYLALWRNRQDQACFAALTPVTARLLVLILEQPAERAGALLVQIAKEMAHPAPATLMAAGTAMLDDLLNQALVLGAA
jgi:hypothetical protein